MKRIAHLSNVENIRNHITEETMEEVMTLVAKLCAAGVACTMLGSCVGAASASPWRLGKNKLPRLSSKPQSIAIEHLELSHGNIQITQGVSAGRKRRNR
jgi:hypothetical protein